MEKTIHKKFLIGYFVIIMFLLVFILFIAPDSLFLKKDSDNGVTYSETTKESSNIEQQKQDLLNGNYDYEYKILYNIGNGTIEYNCKGQVYNSEDNGKCTLPQKIEYSTENKNEIFSKINYNYLDLSYVFKLIENIEPADITYGNERMLIYEIKTEEYETKITIRANKEHIFHIEISNKNNIYYLSFDNINLK